MASTRQGNTCLVLCLSWEKTFVFVICPLCHRNYFAFCNHAGPDKTNTRHHLKSQEGRHPLITITTVIININLNSLFHLQRGGNPGRWAEKWCRQQRTRCRRIAPGIDWAPFRVYTIRCRRGVTALDLKIYRSDHQVISHICTWQLRRLSALPSSALSPAPPQSRTSQLLSTTTAF